MRLYTEGDDYGFTRAVTLGIIDCIDRGVLRNTGLFPNMPAAEFACSFIKDRPFACFGIDFNMVAGPSCADPKDIPALVDENGYFIRSNVRIHDPRWATEEGRREMFPYEQCLTEVRAQYARFKELAGQEPGYFNGHSITPESYLEAIRTLSNETGIPFVLDFMFGTEFHSIINAPKKDLGLEDKASTSKVFDPMDQLNKNPLAANMAISDHLLSGKYAIIGFHPGYVDAELLKYTSLSLERIRDAEMMMSDELKQWISNNNVELGLYSEFKK